ncbi:LysR family transcriptional regulator [Aquabacterium sp.]|uniref:LysR family transcriptional regulator n=1 Tax=Aquabacterium sp. TaxID=1872578 RepID=UPI002CD42CD8|nr:LysR substrate-binding domain-containing protein [Aquabacterium sp.]HSW04620.1 LysR substrate-binding domain-containing protein [Aquabacterium sp.]
MELVDLSVFRTVVSAGGVTRAAKQLHRVQSNITTRVKKLEEELGVALFAREGRRMQLSAAGKLLLDYADRILALADEAKQAVTGGAPQRVLRLGAMESTAAVRLPAPLSQLHRQHPQLQLELHTGSPQQMLAQVLAGELDVALVAEPVADARLLTRPIYDEALVIITSLTHPPVHKPRDLVNGTLLVFHPGCPHRQRLEAWCARGRVVPQRMVEMASYHAILGCAVAGMGVALMPRSVVEAYAERARLGVHAMTGPFSRVRTLLVWRRDTPQARLGALVEALDAQSAHA